MRQKSLRTRFVRALWLGTIFLSIGAPLSAHEKWFVPENPVGAIPSFFRTIALRPAIFLLAAALAIAVLFFVDRGRGQRPFLSRSVLPWLPTVLGICTGISFLFAALQRTIFAQNLPIPDGFFGSWIVVLELLIGLAFVAGFGTRFAAVGALCLSLLSFVWFGWNTLDYLNIVGIALFLLVWGRGRGSVGALFGKLFFALDSSHVRPLALRILHSTTGLTFCFLGFQKIVRPDMHLGVLALFPDQNPFVFYQSFLPFLTANWYLLISATVEVVGGILIASGTFLRPVSALLLIPFLLYPFFFGGSEIPGHLPIIGTLLLFVLLGRRTVSAER